MFFDSTNTFLFRQRQQLGKPIDLHIGSSAGVLKEGNPLGLHFVMFMPAIMGQGTVEQQRKWLPRAQKLQIIGTYAQVNINYIGLNALNFSRLISSLFFL